MIQLPYLIRCINCNWIDCGQSYNTILSVISNHSKKAKHKRIRYYITRISEAEFKIYKRFKDNPQFWDGWYTLASWMSGKSLRRRDIKRMSKLNRSRLLVELSKRLSKIDKNWEYLDINELDKLDEKESNVYAAYWGEKLGLQTLISEIEWDLGISDTQIRQKREMAKAKVRALENRRRCEEFEARERERIRNLPPINHKKWARRQRTLKAYLDYLERAKRLKRESTY